MDWLQRTFNFTKHGLIKLIVRKMWWPAETWHQPNVKFFRPIGVLGASQLITKPKKWDRNTCHSPTSVKIQIKKHFNFMRAVCRKSIFSKSISFSSGKMQEAMLSTSTY